MAVSSAPPPQQHKPEYEYKPEYKNEKEHEPEHEPEHAFDAWKALAQAHRSQCAQLADTLQAVILDNDFYREANEQVCQKAEEAVN
ncbi:hypothetical protein EV175_001028 [Coemansia sp. RSA 1933]|nr:hypothetical protein EV175_001028 [Coemansia sp. RSA 1933]